MTDVYLRHIDNADGVKVGEVPFTAAALDEALRLVAKWNVTTLTDEFTDVILSRFVLDDGHAYFEIVVGLEGDD